MAAYFQPLAPCTCKGIAQVFSKIDTNVSDYGCTPPNEPEYELELWRAKTPAVTGRLIEGTQGSWMRMNDKLGIVGLGRYKQLHELPGSDKTWNSAFNALHDAHEIFAIGFSMSYYDTMTRLHFGSVMHQRKIPPHRISIVDPNACKLAKDFSGVFRDRVCLVEQQAERINWDELLGS